MELFIAQIGQAMSRRRPFQASLLEVEHQMVGLLARSHGLSGSALVAKLITETYRTTWGHMTPAQVENMYSDVPDTSLSRRRIKTANGKWRRVSA